MICLHSRIASSSSNKSKAQWRSLVFDLALVLPSSRTRKSTCLYCLFGFLKECTAETAVAHDFCDFYADLYIATGVQSELGSSGATATGRGLEMVYNWIYWSVGQRSFEHENIRIYAHLKTIEKGPGSSDFKRNSSAHGPWSYDSYFFAFVF